MGSIEDEDPEPSSEMPVIDLELAEEEEEEEEIIALDGEFAVREDHVNRQLEDLKNKKVEQNRVTLPKCTLSLCCYI